MTTLFFSRSHTFGPFRLLNSNISQLSINVETDNKQRFRLEVHPKKQRLNRLKCYSNVCENNYLTTTTREVKAKVLIEVKFRVKRPASIVINQ